MQLLFKLLIYLGLIFMVVVLAAWFFQRRLIYFPDPTRVAPAAIGLTDVSEVELKRPDGVKIIAWHGKAGPGQPTLLYFHGNGANLAARAERIAAYRAAGRGIFMMSYRSYGGSTGKPSETANVADAIAAYDHLVGTGVAAGDILLYGESLGSGVAVQVAVERTVGGIILDAPFTSLADVGAEVYPYLPVRLAIADRYDSLSRIKQLKVSLLIVHGDRDEVVPFRMGQRLFEAANEPKTFAPIRGAGHSDHYQFGALEAINGWIDKVRAALPAGAEK